MDKFTSKKVGWKSLISRSLPCVLPYGVLNMRDLYTLRKDRFLDVGVHRVLDVKLFV